MEYPGLQTGLQTVPLGLLIHVDDITPKATAAGTALQGLGKQADVPIQTPAVQVKVELALKPLLQMGEHANPLKVPAQWL